LIPQLQGDCMTVHQFITSPCNCCYLPFKKVSSQFEDGETRSPACTRCVRPFYEPKRIFIPYGYIRDTDKIIEYRQRPVVHKARTSVDPSQAKCGKPFDIEFEELSEHLELTRVGTTSSYAITQAQQYFLDTDVIVHDKLYLSKAAWDTQTETLTVTDGTMVFFAFENYYHPGYNGSTSIPKGAGYNVAIPQGFLVGTGYSLVRREPIYNRSKFDYSFCNDLFLERSDTRSNICFNCFVELGGTGRSTMNLVSKPFSRGKMKLPRPRNPAQVNAATAARDEARQRHISEHREGKERDPFNISPAGDQRASVGPQTQAQTQVSELSIEDMQARLDTGDITIEDMEIWIEAHFSATQQAEMTTAAKEIAVGQMDFVVATLNPVEQRRLEQQNIMNAKEAMTKNFNNLQAFNDALKAIMSKGPNEDVQSELVALKETYKAAEVIMTSNTNQLTAEYKALQKNAAYAVSHKRFNRHMYRYEVVNDPGYTGGRTIHDMSLKLEIDRQSASNVAAPREDQLAQVNFPGIIDLDATGQQQPTHFQYRAQKMTHLMITYVLHRRASSEEYNKYVIDKIQQATSRMFDHHLGSLINFGKTLRRVGDTWRIEDIGQARKKTNMDNYPESYKFDTFQSHIHYYKCTGGTEIAPTTKFFHFHMILKLVHYSKLMFDYFKMSDWLRKSFLGLHGNVEDNFYIQDVDGTPFYKYSDRPYVDLRLYDQDDWEEVAHEYVRKDQLSNSETSHLITPAEVRKALAGRAA
jgi:hypothetical protein